MARQTKEREDLYARREPPGKSIPCNASRPVKKLCNGRAGGGSTMQAEDTKSWLRGIKREEEAAKEGKEGFEGAGDTWRLFVRLLQHVWDTGEIPQQMLLSLVVLILKGGNEYRDIGLLEVAWKVLKGVSDGRLYAVPPLRPFPGSTQDV